MKKIKISPTALHLVAGTLILGALPMTSLEAARRSMPSSSKTTAVVKKSAKNSTASSKKDGVKSAATKSTKSGDHSETTLQESARTQVSKLTTTQKSKLLDLLNEGSGKDLDAINGIAKIRAESIIKSRPFHNISELILVSGIGEVTFSRIIAHAKQLPRKNSKAASKSRGKSKTASSLPKKVAAK